MTAATDERIRLSNEALAGRIGRLHRGHLAFQMAAHQIREGKGGDELLDEARRSLGTDDEALAAFDRASAKGRQP